jgi:predicted RNA-binding Zn ribbon-like protein
MRFCLNMAKRAPRPPHFELLGGRVCLDFANTLGGIRGGKTFEHLEDYGDLLAWAAESGLLTEAHGRKLRAATTRQPQVAKQVFARGLKLREAIYAIFSSGAEGKRAPAPALAILNNELMKAMTNTRIVQTSTAFDWQLAPELSGIFLPIQAVARDAAELLTSRHLTEVRECAKDTCGWLFLDASRNHSRLWCDMRLCGNRAKQARHRTKFSEASGIREKSVSREKLIRLSHRHVFRLSSSARRRSR